MKTYFIQAITGGSIKIGRSNNPAGRLKELQTSHSSKLRILAVLEEDKESTLHAQFRELREKGEWFRCEKALIEYLLTLDISEHIRKELRRLLLQPVDIAKAPEQRPGEIPCDFVLDRALFESDVEFQNAIAEVAINDGPDCDCDCGWYGDFCKEHFEACCSWGLWDYVLGQIGQNAFAIERFGIDTENRVIYLVSRQLSSVKREQFFARDVPQLAFYLDCVHWGLSVSVFSNTFTAEGVDAFHLFLGKIKGEIPA